jgi:hypothetical protein
VAVLFVQSIISCDLIIFVKFKKMPDQETPASIDGSFISALARITLGLDESDDSPHGQPPPVPPKELSFIEVRKVLNLLKVEAWW